MSLFNNGGGSEVSAAARIYDMSVEEVREKLNDILIPSNHIGNEMKLTLKK